MARYHEVDSDFLMQAAQGTPHQVPHDETVLVLPSAVVTVESGDVHALLLAIPYAWKESCRKLMTEYDPLVLCIPSSMR